MLKSNVETMSTNKLKLSGSALILHTPGSYNVSISEDIRPGTLVTRTVATDADQDIITYAIVDGDQVNTPWSPLLLNLHIDIIPLVWVICH